MNNLEALKYLSDKELMKLMFLKETHLRLGLGKLWTSIYSLEDFYRMEVILSPNERNDLMEYLFSKPSRKGKDKRRQKALKVFDKVIKQQPIEIFDKLAHLQTAM